ncbi:DUF1592 domain-containing protein [bacterium]|nr:MAG: DUF1592 domain-containing protein [bacterium]
MRIGRGRRGHLEITAVAKLTGLALSSAFLTSTLMVGQAKPAAKPKPALKPTFEREGQAFVKKYCARCHGADPVAGFDMTKAKTVAMVQAAGDGWDKVHKNVASKHMPPQGTPQPTKAERDLFLKVLNEALSVNCDLADPGRVTLRRLNRHEYDNTIRDLLGIDSKFAEDFPSDDVGYGFDNIGDVLSLSPLLMEKYLDAAEKISTLAIRSMARPNGFIVAGYDVKGGGASAEGAGVNFFSQGTAVAEPQIPRQGLYTLRITTSADQAGDELPKLAVKIGGETQTVEVKATRKEPQVFEIPFKSSGGKVPISFAFLNDFYDEKLPEGKTDRNVAVVEARILGPKMGAVSEKSPEGRLGLGAYPEDGKERDTAKAVLARFASRAFRRPSTADEVERLVRVYDLGHKAEGTYEAGLRLGLQAVLTSPSFLFRVETDPKVKAGNGLLNPYEMASRLSYFLWSSTPDDRLLELARSGAILKPDVLATETKRMLADPKAQALADNFAEQWLTLRKLRNFQPNPGQFPQFNEKLRESMLQETKQFFMAVVRENKPSTDFLDGKYTFINGPLAKLYGIPGVTGDEFKRVELKGNERGGVLSQAAVLSVTSNPTRTSPVKRGKWVLENILGTPPPPPPPGVGDLGDDNAILSTKDLRKRMEAHRSKPECKGCHARMDPIGFGMENYDAIGRWRTADDGIKIDSTGILPDGEKFAGPSQLKAILMKNQGQFIRTLSDRLLTYGIGRGLDRSDDCHLDAIAQKAKANDYRFQSLIVAVVQSDPFRKRSPEKKP